MGLNIQIRMNDVNVNAIYAWYTSHIHLRVRADAPLAFLPPATRKAKPKTMYIDIYMLIMFRFKIRS